ncbi:MAG TPA: head GIN domain-containing protein [Panacibacter sp.]|mgnify:CR=1 FL=1|nr:head GIN domain-containing protein [Panacibacter sp.]HNP45227.1 head GIN domain-containing protein [Panacibacter sp.]
MRKIFLPVCFLAILFSSCDLILDKTVHGNGTLKKEARTVSNTDKIKSAGSFDIDIVQGSPAGVVVEADENLLPYIITEAKGGALEIHTKEHYRLSSDDKIKVTVTTDRLELLDIAGSGNIRGIGKFAGSDHLKISIAGSGDVDLAVNAPEVESHIAGTGSIKLSGETRESKIEIAGMGNYHAADLKSEDVDIHIAGSGNADVYAESNLNIDIAGSGDVNYHGNASVKQNIAGSGKIKKVD